MNDNERIEYIKQEWKKFLKKKIKNERIYPIRNKRAFD